MRVIISGLLYKEDNSNNITRPQIDLKSMELITFTSTLIRNINIYKYIMLMTYAKYNNGCALLMVSHENRSHLHVWDINDKEKRL